MSLLKTYLTPLLAVALMALGPLTATPAGAVAINITLSGTFDGSLDGQSFDGRALTFTGLSDTDNIDAVFDELHYPLFSLAVSFGNLSYDVTEPTIFFASPLSGLAGIVDPDASKGLVRYDYTANDAFYTDDLTGSFATSGGALLLRAGSGIMVSASTPQTPGAVPEPGTWAMLLLGFAVTGAALRRRRPVAAALRAA